MARHPSGRVGKGRRMWHGSLLADYMLCGATGAPGGSRPRWSCCQSRRGRGHVWLFSGSKRKLSAEGPGARVEVRLGGSVSSREVACWRVALGDQEKPFVQGSWERSVVPGCARVARLLCRAAARPAGDHCSVASKLRLKVWAQEAPARANPARTATCLRRQGEICCQRQWRKPSRLQIALQRIRSQRSSV
jgi:hypothetical protein